MPDIEKHLIVKILPLWVIIGTCSKINETFFNLKNNIMHILLLFDRTKNLNTGGRGATFYLDYITLSYRVSIFWLTRSFSRIGVSKYTSMALTCSSYAFIWSLQNWDFWDRRLKIQLIDCWKWMKLFLVTRDNLK